MEAKVDVVNNHQTIKTWKTWERCVIITKDNVIKRELSEQELVRRPNSDALRPFWAKERLQNEAATIQYVASRTTIPVPDCRLYIKDELLHLETKRIINGVLLQEIEQTSRSAATAAVDRQMETFILPQLRSLRRNHIGSVDSSIPVFPPQRVYDRDRRPWQRVYSEADDFVLCHNDLGPQNILIHPVSFEIVGIIDWEFAGYFPQYFELPLWRGDLGGIKKMYEDANSRELEFFGLSPSDLRDCIPPL
jgi:thiamine kinase-like enzyme